VKQNNIINLSDYRKEKTPPQIPLQYIQDFEVGGYYIYPKLGVMIHCMLITDNSHTHNNELMYIMEDQFGNIFSVPIDDPDGAVDWCFLEKEVFTKMVKKHPPESEFEPEPPRVG